MRFSPRTPLLPERLAYVHGAHLCVAHYPNHAQRYEILLKPQAKNRQKIAKTPIFNTISPT